MVVSAKITNILWVRSDIHCNLRSVEKLGVVMEDCVATALDAALGPETPTEVGGKESVSSKSSAVTDENKPRRLFTCIRHSGNGADILLCQHQREDEWKGCLAELKVSYMFFSIGPCARERGRRKCDVNRSAPT